MKRGFSMIELIFVIVILGILASVALPKLAATRDDASASGIKSDVGTITQAVPALYMSQKVPSITQAVPSLNINSWLITSQYQVDTKIQTTTSAINSPCITINIVEGNTTSPSNAAIATMRWTAAGDPNGANNFPYPWLMVQIDGETKTGACDVLYNMGIRDQNVTMQGFSIVW